MIIYLSGPITGNPKYKVMFMWAENIVRSKGHIPLNPAVFPQGMEYEQYMNIGFSMLDEADGILMMPGWKLSNGAKRELRYAVERKKKVYIIKDEWTKHMFEYFAEGNET